MHILQSDYCVGLHEATCITLSFAFKICAFHNVTRGGEGGEGRGKEKELISLILYVVQELQTLVL